MGALRTCVGYARVCRSRGDCCVIFISYASEDRRFVDGLLGAVRGQGFDAWVDKHEIRGGQDWQDQVIEALDSCR